MLKFFRNIRQNLVNEGSIKKYLLYSIGEILLVMIGILLALQVNNWNETQKSRKEENTLIQQLVVDLDKEVQTFNELFPRIADKMKVAKQLYLESQGKANYDATINYGDLTWQIHYSFNFQDRHQGSLPQLLSQQHRERILDYFSQEQRVAFQLKQMNDYINAHVRSYLGRHKAMNMEKVMVTDDLLEVRKDKTDFIQHEPLQHLFDDPIFSSILFNTRMGNMGLLHDVKTLLEENRQLKNYLQNSLVD